MDIPCTIKALKYIKHGKNLEMREGAQAEVTLEHDKNSKFRYRMLKVTTNNAVAFFTEKALENAIERGEFSVV